MTIYEQLQELNEKLWRLVREGHGDSPEADAIRDEMDPLWAQLSEEERAELSLHMTGLMMENPE